MVGRKEKGHSPFPLGSRLPDSYRCSNFQFSVLRGREMLEETLEPVLPPHPGREVSVGTQGQNPREWDTAALGSLVGLGGLVSPTDDSHPGAHTISTCTGEGRQLLSGPRDTYPARGPRRTICTMHKQWSVLKP